MRFIKTSFNIFFILSIIIFGNKFGCQRTPVKKSRILYLPIDKSSLYTIDINGSGSTELFRTDFKPQWPSWSTQGNEIIFNTYDKKYEGVYIFNILDNNLKKIRLSQLIKLH